jgi:hypothetical protein
VHARTEADAEAAAQAIVAAVQVGETQGRPSAVVIETMGRIETDVPESA